MDFIKSNRKNIVNILSAIVTYISILGYLNFLSLDYSYDFIVSMLFTVILYIYVRFDRIYDKRTKLFSLILSIAMGLILVVGKYVYEALFVNVGNIFNFKNFIFSLFYILGFTLFFQRIFRWLFKYSKKINIVQGKCNSSKLGIRIFILLIFLMVGCWFVYFLKYYPAILTPDSHYVIRYSEYKILSDHHTFGHTWFFGFIYYVGKFIFGSQTKGIAFYILIQMFLLATIYNFAIKYFYQKGLKKIYCVCLWLIFALSPLHGHYSVTLWRDILFSASFLLIFISLFEFNSNNYIVSKKYLFYFIIGTLLMLFFRNNGIYIYIFMFPFLWLVCSNRKFLMRFIYLSIIVFYYVVKGPLFDVLGVEQAKTVEAYSIPLQQIARVIASDKYIDDDIMEELKDYIDVNKVKVNYKPYISDPIKSLTNSDYLSKNVGDFIKVWFKLLMKYPNVYVEAYLSQTLGYWYPSVEYWSVGTQISSINGWETIECHSLLSNELDRFLEKTKDKNIPFGMFIWSLGLQFIIILVSSLILLYKKNYSKLLAFVPLYGLWVSIMIATPVFSELRYVYALFICSPFCLIVSLLDDSRLKKN